jgi:RNA polymerase sigma factor (sigma-70 family)
MAADPQRPPSAPAGRRRLSVEEARFYAKVYDSARRGSVNELRQKGCSEEEAEEFFATAFGKVMERVNPIEREFKEPQMVDFIKRASWTCMIDERRRRGQRPEIELGQVRSLSDATAESPDEAAEEREAVAIGREALEMLSERDRLIFRQRHQMNLSPEEILENMPGLSLRTYRKVIGRANARVLDAFERIEGGARCEEMEAGLLRRYVGGESSAAEQSSVQAHLAHCRSCQKAQARMKGYLLDVASSFVALSSLANLLGHASSRLPGLASDGSALSGASRGLRDRARDLLIRIAGLMPGSGSDATVGQAFTAPWVKIAAACTSGIAVGGCVAAGVVPGIGGVGILSQHHASPKRPAHVIEASPAPSLIDRLPSPSPAAPAAKHASSAASRKASPARHSSPAPAASRDTSPIPNSPSSARRSDSVTSSEFGAESGQPVSPPPSEPPPSSAPSGSSGSAGSEGASPGGASGSSKSSGESDFGL